jgi:hypothetical protein
MIAPTVLSIHPQTKFSQVLSGIKEESEYPRHTVLIHCNIHLDSIFLVRESVRAISPVKVHHKLGKQSVALIAGGAIDYVAPCIEEPQVTQQRLAVSGAGL